MKRIKLGLMVCLSLLGAQAFGESRIFTDAQGRNIEAELMKFEERSNTVTIKRAGARQSKRVPITVFSEKDQVYIRDWGRLQALHDSRFEVVFSKSSKKDADLSYGTYASTEVFTDHNFNIRFENGTESSLADLEFEYVIFYEQEDHAGRGHQKTETKQGVLYKKTTISLPAKKDTEVSSAKLKLREWKTASIAAISSDVHGIRVRLTQTSESGEKAMREFCYPKGLKYSWSDQTVNVQRRVSR